MTAINARPEVLVPDTATAWDDEFTHVLWRAQNAVHRQVQDALESLGVTATQLGLAVHLDDLGPLSAADLSRGFRIAPQSIGTALGRLEELGWVERRKMPANKRVVLYELTELGVERTTRGRQAMGGTNAGVTEVLTPAETQTLIGLLRRVTAGIEGPDVPLTSTRTLPG